MFTQLMNVIKINNTRCSRQIPCTHDGQVVSGSVRIHLNTYFMSVSLSWAQSSWPGCCHSRWSTDQKYCSSNWWCLSVCGGLDGIRSSLWIRREEKSRRSTWRRWRSGWKLHYFLDIELLWIPYSQTACPPVCVSFHCIPLCCCLEWIILYK